MEAELANVGLLLAALSALDIEKNKNKKDFILRCEASEHGMKVMGHTKAYDVCCICVLGPAIFTKYNVKTEDDSQNASISNPDMTVHSFSVSRMILYNALENHLGLVTRLTFDATEQQLSIIRVGSEGTQSRIQLDVVQPDYDVAGELFKESINEVDDSFIITVSRVVDQVQSLGSREYSKRR